ncbi:MAG: dephospho-CoA kinase, partial [Bifidobacteriaceae bacterium]|nr:dephospho-CoA kinase [Bifidobacteriaceae bacterium]
MCERPNKVALTGGLAAGKSTAANLLASAGLPVLDLDQVARLVVAPGTPGLAQVVACFGEHILLPSGALDRFALADLVFADA